jgi:uncharacterized protein YyaL (SSP411 family)
MKATPVLLTALFIASTAANPYTTRLCHAATDTAPATALPSASQVMAEAKTKAAAEHKNILLVFSASWCGPCHMFDAFLRDPSTGPIMERNFVIEHLDVGEKPGDKRHSDSPGGEALRASLNGANAGYPFIVILDPAGKTIVNSYLPVKGSSTGDNIGYPALPSEIDWFMKMLRQSAPAISAKEADTIRDWLQQRGHS